MGVRGRKGDARRAEGRKRDKIGGAEEAARESSLARRERIFEYNYTARVNRVAFANEQRATQEMHLSA